MIRVQSYRFNFAREPLIRPLQIKGSSFTEKWTLVTRVESAQGMAATGIGGTAVLWSDPAVFQTFSEAGGNGLMALLAEKAVQLARGRDFTSPLEAMDSLLPEVHEFGRKASGIPGLKKTFTLNALVSLDLALWVLWAREKGLKDFDALIPGEYRQALSHRPKEIVQVPTVSYNYPLRDLMNLVEEGHFFLKIKLGQPGDPGEMVEKDGARLAEIHQALQEKGGVTPAGRKVLYYLDANGRYPDKDTLSRLLDKMEGMGMMDRVSLLEEPFAEEVKADISDLPVRVAADESLHDLESLEERIGLGYRAFALKPAGKTLSMSLRMAGAAHLRGIPCFVADNACVPLLVEWNKNFAARLPPFPGLPLGILESNGRQNYRDWDHMIADHPCRGAGWIQPRGGVYLLDEDFYRTSGGVFLPPGGYQRLVEGSAL